MHIENLFFILLVAAAALLRFLAKKASESRDSESTQERSTSVRRVNTPTPRPESDSDEERIRRFLEALGQPSTSPSPVPPRPTYERPIVMPQVPPPMTPRPPKLPKQVQIPRQVVAPVDVRMEIKPAPAQPAFQVRETEALAEPVAEITAPAERVAAQEIATAGEGIDLRILLRSTAGLRNAVLLREILGPPRGLQRPDLIAAA